MSACIECAVPKPCCRCVVCLGPSRHWRGLGGDRYGCRKCAAVAIDVAGLGTAIARFVRRAEVEKLRAEILGSDVCVECGDVYHREAFVCPNCTSDMSADGLDPSGCGAAFHTALSALCAMAMEARS